MKLVDLYVLKPPSLGVASLVLKDGRSLVEALNTYPGIHIPLGQRLTIQRMVKAIAAANLPADKRTEIDNLEIDELSVVEGNPVDFSALTQANHGLVNSATSIVAVLVLAIITISFTGCSVWIAYTEHKPTVLYDMLSLIIPWMMIVWKGQGIISKERRDIMSVLVGDSSTQRNLWDKLSDINNALRAPATQRPAVPVQPQPSPIPTPQVAPTANPVPPPMQPPPPGN